MGEVRVETDLITGAQQPGPVPVGG
jgi:hypothetical protein